ncbi:DUF4123 domain-containing protein [Chromobacterium haemolyticum]|uniref:DUF4123 domain-containing protein n=1 Tax=Chromobacterium TaxID=535 RepID=UPI0018879A10|nr:MULTISPECIES: DUF4123 domain-containing protein [Chromobacterium]QOZ84313.1 DUF4123 domain-containing protein [Chromobacterium sp. Rain0013]WON84499.1 DUF4123 domain-containing protein [Chromobacterium haemolyticum]
MQTSNQHAAILRQLQARQQAGAQLLLALDAPSRPLAGAEAELDAQVRQQGLPVPLKHTQLDPARQPAWLPLIAGAPALADSIAQAQAETEPDALTQGQGRRVAGWLEIAGSAKLAAAHIGRQMIRRTPNGETHLLRLHDPAVSWALWPLLNAAQQRGLLGSVSRWWLLDPAGELICLEPTQTVAGAPRPLSRWEPDLWEDIARIGPLNRALLAWRELAPECDDGKLESARLHAFTALRHASALGFDDEEDLSRFALHAITVHPRFYLHPRVQALLAGREADDFYSGLTDSLSETDWAAIAASA